MRSYPSTFNSACSVTVRSAVLFVAEDAEEAAAEDELDADDELDDDLPLSEPAHPAIAMHPSTSASTEAIARILPKDDAFFIFILSS